MMPLIEHISQNFSGCKFTILWRTFIETTTSTDGRLSCQSTGPHVSRRSQEIYPMKRKEIFTLLGIIFLESKHIFLTEKLWIFCFSFRPYPPLMSTGPSTVMYSPPLENYPSGPTWYSSSNSPHPGMPILIPMNNCDQIQLQHHLSVNVTDHYESTPHPSTHPYPVYSTGTAATTTSSNHDTMSSNGSLSSGTSTNESSPYPLLTPMPTVFFNPYPPSLPNDQHPSAPYFSSTAMYFPSPLSPRLLPETRPTTIINEPSMPRKFVLLSCFLALLIPPHVFSRFLPAPNPIVMMVKSLELFGLIYTGCFVFSF